MLHFTVWLLLLVTPFCSGNNINPGGRYDGASWLDYDSNLWIFGGYGFGEDSSAGYLNDLWVYVTSNSTWNWLSGDQMNAFGRYSGPNMRPGARTKASVWITPDKQTVYLFGGYGYAAAGTPGFLSDMWRFDIPNRAWTFIDGSSIVNTRDVREGSPDLWSPSGRVNSAVFVRSATELFLFGGGDLQGSRSDTWMFNVTSNNWTPLHGPSQPNQPATYGQPGIENPNNIPSSRSMTGHWKDSNGYFWIFGGLTINEASINEVWRFNPSSLSWAFMAGSTVVNDEGVYGTKGRSSGGRIPARFHPAVWTDPFAEEVVIFGGSTRYDRNGSNTMLNDVWRFRPSTLEFIWIAGDSQPDQEGDFGELGVPSRANIPSSRFATNFFQLGDEGWLFGGMNFNLRTGTRGALNDLWHFHIDQNKWTWLDGSRQVNRQSVYRPPPFNIINIPEYLSGNIRIFEKFTDQEWRGSFVKSSSGSSWNVSAQITNYASRSSLIYSDSRLISQELDGTQVEACVSPDQVLSDDVVGAAVQQAQQINDDDIKDPLVKACIGDKWEVNVLQDLFVVCREKGTGDWKIYGVNFHAVLSHLVTSPALTRKRTTNVDDPSFTNRFFNCSRAENIAFDVPSVKWYQRDFTKPAREDPFECVFLHGVGQDETLATKTEPWKYFEFVDKVTPQCGKRTFGIRETKLRGWTNTELQQEYCELLTGQKTGGVVTNKLIFVHSMGNLILGAAIKNGYCKLGDSAYWYNIQGPTLGSPAAKALDDACSRLGLDSPLLSSLDFVASLGTLYLTGIPILQPVSGIFSALLTNAGYCISTTEVYPAYRTLIPADLGGPTEFNDVQETIRQHVHGVMCGDTPWAPSWNLDMAGLAAVHYITGKFHPYNVSDGMVPLPSCQAAAPDKEFMRSYASKYYVASINHSDGRCTRDDGWWGDHRRPCMWYSQQGLTESQVIPVVSLASCVLPFSSTLIAVLVLVF